MIRRTSLGTSLGTSLVMAALTLTFTFACSKQDTAATSDTRPVATSEASSNTSQAAQLTPEELGELGAKIKASPSDAQKLLAEKGLNEQSFEQAIRKVAENPEESKRYAAAFKKTGA